jgi:hypothetical protein
VGEGFWKRFSLFWSSSRWRAASAASRSAVSTALLLGELRVLDVAEVEAVGKNDAADHRKRGEEHADAEAFVP